MCGRSGTTIDLRIPTMPGWNTSGFHRPGRTPTNVYRPIYVATAALKSSGREAVYVDHVRRSPDFVSSFVASLKSKQTTYHTNRLPSKILPPEFVLDRSPPERFPS